MVRKLLKRWTSILLAIELALFYALLFAQLAVPEGTKLLVFIAFLGVTWFIMVTIWALMLAIVTDGAEERPTGKAKGVLFVGTVFYTVNALPYEVWSHVLPTCTLVYASCTFLPLPFIFLFGYLCYIHYIYILKRDII